MWPVVNHVEQLRFQLGIFYAFYLNSLSPGRCGCSLRLVILNSISPANCFHEEPLFILLVLEIECSNIKSTFVLMLSAWCVSLHRRHNDHDGVSNHQPHGCLLNRLFKRRSKKTSKLRFTGLCVGNSPGPVNSPHKGPVTRKMFPFDDVIMSMCLAVLYLCIIWVPIGFVCVDFEFTLLSSTWRSQNGFKSAHREHEKSWTHACTNLLGQE